QTLPSMVRDSLLRERLMATLSGFFGALAALIATIGLYGVMSYTVARRRNEIGIRMALGADRRDVVRMVMGEAGALLVAGVIVGAGAAKLTRDSAWKSAGAVRLQFRTWHPQGLVKIDRTLFLSSVEVRSSDRRDGVGHLFKIDMAGALVADLALGEGAVYHPG